MDELLENSEGLDKLIELGDAPDNKLAEESLNLDGLADFNLDDVLDSAVEAPALLDDSDDTPSFGNDVNFDLGRLGSDDADDGTLDLAGGFSEEELSVDFELPQEDDATILSLESVSDEDNFLPGDTCSVSENVVVSQDFSDLTEEELDTPEIKENAWLDTAEGEATDLEAEVATPFEEPMSMEEETVFEDAVNEEEHVEQNLSWEPEAAHQFEETPAEIEDVIAEPEEETEAFAEQTMAIEPVLDEGVSWSLEPDVLATTSVMLQEERELYQEAPNFVKWYSGSVHDEMFELSKQNLPPEVNGDAVTKIVHLNVGYDTYGWLVEFDNGLTMSLEDVRRYQIRNGALPSFGGVVRYGQAQCRFANVERILIYESVRYFSYGA